MNFLNRVDRCFIMFMTFMSCVSLEYLNTLIMRGGGGPVSTTRSSHTFVNITIYKSIGITSNSGLLS